VGQGFFFFHKCVALCCSALKAWDKLDLLISVLQCFAVCYAVHLAWDKMNILGTVCHCVLQCIEGVGQSTCSHMCVAVCVAVHLA